MLMLGLNEKRAVGNGKQCVLVWTNVELVVWLCLEKYIRVSCFEARSKNGRQKKN